MEQQNSLQILMRCVYFVSNLHSSFGLGEQTFLNLISPETDSHPSEWKAPAVHLCKSRVCICVAICVSALELRCQLDLN